MTISSAIPRFARATEGDPTWGVSAPLQAHERANLAAVTTVAALWNERAVDGILEHYVDGIVWRNVATGEVLRGKTQVGQYLHELFSAVPDLSMTITSRIARGRFVAEQYVIAGTHLGTLFGIPATGQPLRLPAASFVEMRDGKFQEDHFYLDVNSLLGQMGLMPPATFTRTRPGRIGMAVAVFLRYPWRSLTGSHRRPARPRPVD